MKAKDLISELSGENQFREVLVNGVKVKGIELCEFDGQPAIKLITDKDYE